jgi:hypothetical protein
MPQSGFWRNTVDDIKDTSWLAAGHEGLAGGVQKSIAALDCRPGKFQPIHFLASSITVISGAQLYRTGKKEQPTPALV